MVLLSRVLNFRANRLANIVAGTIMTALQLLSLIATPPTLYYAFFSVIEIACTTVVVWYAWTWTRDQGALSGQAESLYRASPSVVYTEPNGSVSSARRSLRRPS